MKLRRFLTLLILLGVFVTGIMPVMAQVDEDFIGSYLESVPDGFGVVRADALSVELLENPLFLVDVREPNEWAETGYIEGAVNVPVRTIAQNLDLLPADLDTPIVVYCKAGTRGAIAMTTLQILGYTNVRNLAGGIDGWMDEGNPVATDDVEFEAVGPAAIDSELVAAVDNYLTNVLPQGWGMVTPTDLSIELLENPPFLLDVREQGEWDSVGYIDGAVHVPLREIGMNFDMLPDMGTPIVVYCAGGHRGAIAMVSLQMLGYEVRNLAGGINGWIGAGYEVVGAAPEVSEAEADIADAQGELDLTAHLDNYLQNELPEGFGTVSADQLFTELLETPPFLLDVREPNELEENGYILGAVNVPVRSIAQNLDLLPADLDAPIVVYCAAGTRGAIGMVALQVLGYTNVRNLSGGIGAWTGAEYEVITDPIPEPVAGEMAPIDPALVAAVDDYLTNVLPQGWGGVRADALAVELVENPPFLLDVREDAELENLGYIEGSVHVPLRQVVANLDQLPGMDTPIVVYCHGGHRGAIAMVTLQMLGYDVRNLAGGIQGWITAGYDVVGGTAVEEAPAEEVEVTLPEGSVVDAATLQPLVVDAIVSVATKDGFGTLTNDSLRAVIDNVTLVDVRTDDEWAGGHIPGAIHIPMDVLAQHLYKLPEDMSAPIVIYCAGGQRGAMAQLALTMLGYEDVMNLRTGYNGWDGDTTTDAEPAAPVNAFPAVDPDVWTTVDAYLTGLEGFGVISVADLNTLIVEDNAPYLIDVRELSEYDQGRIIFAVNMPTRSFDQHLDLLPEMDVPVVVYGSSGPRGATVMTGLQMLGYDARNLGGGSAAWTAAGFPLVAE